MPTLLQSHLNKNNQNSLRSGSSELQPMLLCELSLPKRMQRKQKKTTWNTLKTTSTGTRYSLLVTPSRTRFIIVRSSSLSIFRRSSLVVLSSSILLLYNSTRSFHPSSFFLAIVPSRFCMPYILRTFCFISLCIFLHTLSSTSHSIIQSHPNRNQTKNKTQ